MASVDATSNAAPGSRAADDDLDPAAFLKSVRELSEKREREDAERFRKLEEEVERSRAQRAARRAERERSLSPEKSSTPRSTAPHHLRTPSRASRVDSPTPAPPSVSQSPPPPPYSTSADPMASSTLPPTPESPTKDIPEFRGFGSIKKKTTPSVSPATRSIESFEDAPKPSPSASSLARSGTLSWQQRPEFRTGSRPASVVSTSPSVHSQTSSTNQSEPSRDQIAASLGSRDPSWFRQTADRGIGSPAYKKSNDEASATPGEMIRRGLPGMSRERQRTRSPGERMRSGSPSVDAKKETTSASNRFSSYKTPASTSSKPDLRSLIAEDEAQAQASPMVEAKEQSKQNRAYVMSPSQSNISSAEDRPSSPTKGVGGFVNSAMMQRSESASKRWSAQPSAGRPGSALSHVSSIIGLQGSQSMPRLDPPGGDRPESPERIGRANSRNHAGLTVSTGETTEAGFVRPSLPSHSRSRSVASPYGTTSEAGFNSPTTMKRFSPTKSSWIEKALVREESPKPMAPAKNTQPAWMANIAKAKADKAGGDYTPRFGSPKTGEEDRSRSASPSKFGQSLLRRSESRDLAAVPSSTPPPMPTATSYFSKPSEPTQSSPRPTAQPSAVLGRAESPKRSTEGFKSREASPVRPTTTTSEAVKSAASPAVSKPKPATPPKPAMDFRSNLRPRAPTESKPAEEPEFLSKFGNLKRTKTEKYVAPDFLKGEITRGKAELNKTGGPVKTARRDELKESLLAKKEEMRKAKEEGRDLPGQAHERKHSNAPITPSKPEALAKRELLGRSESSKSGSSPEKVTNSELPEALMRQKSMRRKPEVEPSKQTSLPVETQPRMETLSKQTSAPESAQNTPAEKSKLAARFNPGLAGLLARGPPSASPSNTPSRTASPAKFDGASDAPSEGAPLQDMRKGRAKGPKKRKQGGGASSAVTSPSEPEPTRALPQPDETPAPSPKPRALPGSAASIMMSSLGSRGPPSNEDQHQDSPQSKPAKAPSTDIPEFGGFGAARKLPSSNNGSADEDKENAMSSKAAEASASFWNRHKGVTPARTQSPSRFSFDNNDEGGEAAFASTPSRSNGVPPKPGKPSRVVSGQLREGSPNK